MEKDFDTWNIHKKRIHSTSKPRLYKSRQIWWCRLGLNIGSEQDGGGLEYERPVLVLRGFGPHTCVVLPLTTSLKIHHLRICIGVIDGKEASVILSQIKVIDTRRLVEQICFLDKPTFEVIRKAVRNLF